MHWPENYPEEKIHGRNRPSYAPSNFDGIQKSLITAAPQRKKKTIKATAESGSISRDELPSFTPADEISRIRDIILECERRTISSKIFMSSLQKFF